MNKQVEILIDNAHFTSRINPILKHIVKTKFSITNNSNIKDWCDKNCEKHWAALFNHWYFESKADAMLFKLAWG